MAANRGGTGTTGGSMDRDVSNVSKESTMSIRFESERTNSSIDENVFDDAKRALAPSGVTPKQFIGPDGSVRHMSPHMVNVHQFYPEITFSLDKGSVGEVVETPRSAGARPGVTKSSSKIDLKETILEEQQEDGELTKESTELDADSEEKNARRGKVTKKSLSSDDDDDDDEADDGKDLFQTQVDEETLDAARARGIVTGGATLFNPENWGPMRSQTWTVEQITSEKAAEHSARGQEHVASEQYEEAVKCFTKAINLQPKHIEYYTQRGEAYLQLCDYQSAILNYKKACILDADNPQYYNRLAFIYYFSGQCLFDQKLFPEALESFSRAAEMRPEIVGYHMRSIACLAALQRHGECLALVNKRLEAENDNPDLYVMRARLHQLFRNATLCYYDVKDALALDEEHEQAQALMHQLEEKALEFRQQSTNMSLTGRFRDALQKISISIETNPSVADFHNIRGAAHRKLGDFNAAIDDYLLALDKTDHNEEDPVYVEAQRQLLLTYNDFAVECFNKGFYEEAIILLNKAIKGEKSEKGLYVNRGDCFFKEANLQFALADYHQALELAPNDRVIHKRIAIVHNEYGVHEYLEKKNKEAESRFTLAIQNDSTNAKYYISRARTRHLLENFHGARQDVLMAIHLDPTNNEVPSLLQRFFHGKSVKEVLASQAAVTVRKQLQQLVAAVPVKLEPVSASHSRSSTRTGMLTSLGGTISALDGGGLATTGVMSDASDDAESVTESLIKDGVVPPIANSHQARKSLSNLKVCMKEKEFNVQIIKEKREINRKIVDSYHNRKSLSAKGAKIAALPEAVSLQKQVHSVGKQELALKEPKKTTGWRNFGLGISGGATA